MLYQNPNGKLTCHKCRSDDVEIAETSSPLGCMVGKEASKVIDSICWVDCVTCGTRSEETYRDFFRCDETEEDRKRFLADKVIQERGRWWFKKPRSRGAMLH